nr:MAG TPA: Flagellar biosynthetic protein FliP, Flagellar, Flagella, Cryo-EM, Export, Membrane [Caudoviricetes sp.]
MQATQINESTIIFIFPHLTFLLTAFICCK